MKSVQEILVLDQGSLAERGSCHELLEGGKVFPELWKRQAINPNR